MNIWTDRQTEDTHSPDTVTLFAGTDPNFKRGAFRTSFTSRCEQPCDKGGRSSTVTVGMHLPLACQDCSWIISLLFSRHVRYYSAVWETLRGISIDQRFGCILSQQSRRPRCVNEKNHDNGMYTSHGGICWAHGAHFVSTQHTVLEIATVFFSLPAITCTTKATRDNEGSTSRSTRAFTFSPTIKFTFAFISSTNHNP